MAAPFGTAIGDFHRGEQEEPLIQRDGERTRQHPIERFYFSTITPEDPPTQFLEESLSGPLLDVGAGAGRHALYFQEDFETTALEVSDHLVAVMRDRGVQNAVEGDMFALPSQFERDRFSSVLLFGTQAGLTGSIDGLRQLLSDLAEITGPDGTAVIDTYDPTVGDLSDILGYRPLPSPGLAHRVFYFEYDGNIGDILRFCLFSPARFRDATVGTPWTVRDVARSPNQDHHVLIYLEK